MISFFRRRNFEASALILCLPAAEKIESDCANQKLYATKQIFHGGLYGFFMRGFLSWQRAELSFLPIFLAAVDYVVIIGRKIIDRTATSFPLRALAPHRDQLLGCSTEEGLYVLFMKFLPALYKFSNVIKGCAPGRAAGQRLWPLARLDNCLH